MGKGSEAGSQSSDNIGHNFDRMLLKSVILFATMFL